MDDMTCGERMVVIRNDGVDANGAGGGSYSLELNYGYMARYRYASGYDCAYAWRTGHWAREH